MTKRIIFLQNYFLLESKFLAEVLDMLITICSQQKAVETQGNN